MKSTREHGRKERQDHTTFVAKTCRARCSVFFLVFLFCNVLLCFSSVPCFHTLYRSYLPFITFNFYRILLPLVSFIFCAWGTELCHVKIGCQPLHGLQCCKPNSPNKVTRNAVYICCTKDEIFSTHTLVLFVQCTETRWGWTAPQAALLPNTEKKEDYATSVAKMCRGTDVVPSSLSFFSLCLEAG